VAGCATGGKPGRVVEAQRVFRSGGTTALVVIGAALNHKPQETFGLFGSPAWWGASFSQIDRRTGTVIPGGGQLNVWRDHCPPLEIKPNGCNEDYQVVSHFPFEVPPGDYMLTSVWGENGKITRFAREEASMFANVPDSLATGEVPWFSVQAGEVLYIGDLIFDLRGPTAKIVEIKRNDAGAQEMLRRYENIEGQIVFRPVRAAKVPGAVD
jgi:hypothetical protein